MADTYRYNPIVESVRARQPFSEVIYFEHGLSAMRSHEGERQPMTIEELCTHDLLRGVGRISGVGSLLETWTIDEGEWLRNTLQNEAAQQRIEGEG